MQTDNSDNLPLPSVSILLPIRNEKIFINKTLKSILSQDYPQEKLELVIADGNSNDGTIKEIKKIKKQFYKIKILHNKHLTMPKGFNLTLKHSKSDIVLMLGGHSDIPYNYISVCVNNLIKYNADCSGGVIKAKGEGFWGKVIASSISSIFGVGNVSFRIKNGKSGYVNSVPFGCYKRSVFDKIGMLDENLTRNQDDEFNFRMIQSGYKIWQDSSLAVIYYSRLSLKKLFIQYLQYGFYKVRVIQKRKALISLRHVVPTLFIISLFMPKISIYIFAIYLLLGLFFSLKINKLNIFKVIASLLTFFIIHVSYGVGFLFGLFRFINFWKNDENR